MKKLWPCLLLLAATAGCGTVGGYQASPRWKVIVTDADGKPRSGCKASLSWAYYFGREVDQGDVTKLTDDSGEALFEPVVLRPNVGKVWSGRAAGALNVHASYGPSATVYVTKAGFDRMQVSSPEGTHLENGVAVSRLVMMPPDPPATLTTAIRAGDLLMLQNEIRRNLFYATNTLQAASLLHLVISSRGGQGDTGVSMANAIVGEWKSAHPNDSKSRQKLADTWVKSYGLTPMEGAVKALRHDIVEALLSSGASPNTSWNHFYPNNPPLHLAVGKGGVEMVRLLLRFKAEINQKRFGDGLTALDLAEQGGKTEIAELLRAAGGKRSNP